LAIKTKSFTDACRMCFVTNRQKHHLSYMATIYCFLYVKTTNVDIKLKIRFNSIWSWFWAVITNIFKYHIMHRNTCQTSYQRLYMIKYYRFYMKTFFHQFSSHFWYSITCTVWDIKSNNFMRHSRLGFGRISNRDITHLIVWDLTRILFATNT